MAMPDIHIEIFDTIDRGLVFDDSDQEENIVRLGTRMLFPGNEYPFFMRCDRYPHDPRFKFGVIATDTSGEEYQVELWEKLPET